ncbi:MULTISPECIES: class I SAM-dependent methyltransferase [unclassified Microbacterium]|uniref:class I SAM-dependent methyltransferase n=1 Tax=unclassified Microbacterium TaxID=2609290 RepID=UPI0012F7E273|nr:class I SAM-dependent methyltransferase [Microbacterium sp. MAH-37]MVQ41841.1 methyltransferase domain-containing protein [Microbacterium sp. MAH-37]
MQVDRKRIVLDPFTIEDADVVDIRMDGHRVWSARVPYAENGAIVLEWPEALRVRLSGVTTLTLTDSASGRELDALDVRFGRSTDRLELVDARGHWLAMTKWDRLGPVLEGREDEIGRVLLENARLLVDDLQADGHDVYIVGGTLLGIVRDGALMPHDDDVDLAFLCRSESPVDVGLASYEMERALLKRGYTVVRHSLAHLEIEFFNDDGEPDHYVDIFTGFFHKGLYCQPFALRGPEVVPSDLVPVQSYEVDGVELPGPPNPEAWLSYAYGSGWRVPDPTFKFITPRETRMRFEGWFGVFNRGRVFWDKSYLEREESSGFADARGSIDAFLKGLPKGARILDLGCGDGRWSAEIARRGYRVTAVDYSHEALRLARKNDTAGLVDFHYLNVNDMASLLAFGARMLGTGDEWFIFAHHSVQALPKTGRRNLYRFFDLVLRGQGYAELVNDTTFSKRYQHSMPSTWHLPTEWVEEEAEEYGFDLSVTRRRWRLDSRQLRRVETVRVRRGGDDPRSA